MGDRNTLHIHYAVLISQKIIKISNTFSSITRPHPSLNIVKFSSLIIVDIHLGGLLQMIEKLYSLILYSSPVGQYQG